MLLRELQIRKNKIEKIIAGTRKWLTKAPKGNLRLSKGQYYLVTDKNDHSGVLIKDYRLVCDLATKQYYSKVLKEAETELSQIDKLIEIERKQPVAHIYSDMSKERRKLIQPVEKTIQERIKDWLEEKEISLPKKTGTRGITTLRGDLVRSQPEQRIADALYKAGIPYKYDVEFGYDNFKSYWVDFEVMNPNTGKKYYWEHLGMMDNGSYVAKNMEKLDYYASCGLYPCNDLILTFDDNNHKLSDKHIQRIIKDLLL